MKNRSRYLILILIVVLFVTILLTGLVVLTLLKSPSSEQSQTLKTLSLYQPKPREIIGEQYLFTEVPNFDRLSLEDLPYISSNLVGRSVIYYKEHLVITSENKIIEYNPKNNQIVRQSNMLLPRIGGLAVIEDNLYIVGDSLDKKENDFPGKTVIYVVSLKTGKIVKILLNNDQRDFANLNLVSKDGYLWGGSWDGVFKIDPTLGTITELVSKNKLYSPHLAFENGKLMASDGQQKFEYNYITQTWDEKPFIQSNDDLQYSKNNSIFEELSLQLPPFLSVYPITNDKHYLFADIGVFTLERGQFPKQFLKVNLKHPGGLGGASSLVTKDEKYAVLITKRWWAGDNPIPDSFTPTSIDIIQLEEKTVYDLIGKKSKLFDSKKVKLLLFDRYISLKEISDNTVMLYDENDKQLGKIDLKAKRLIIF